MNQAPSPDKIYGLQGPHLLGEASEELHPLRELANTYVASGWRSNQHSDAQGLVSAKATVPHEFQGSTVRFYVDSLVADVRRLPRGYFYKGSTARVILASALGQDEGPPRDLDVVRWGRTPLAEDRDVAVAFMPDDFSRGHGVEVCGSPDRYFKSRDISINEVCLDGDVLHASLSAALDRLAQLFRPCKYIPGTLRYAPRVHGGVSAKIIRLFAESVIRGERWLVTGVHHDAEASAFQLAVQLNRAFQRSELAAREFARSCFLLGLSSFDVGVLDVVPAHVDRHLLLLVDELAKYVPGGLEFFDMAPPEYTRPRMRTTE